MSAAPLMTPRPMLASAMTEVLTGRAFDARFASGWALEEKLDGHRCLVRVRNGGVSAYSRPRGSTAAPLSRELPPVMRKVLGGLLDCDLDGELVATGGKSWDVVRTGATQTFVAFDVLAYDGTDYTTYPYDLRRSVLLQILATLPPTQTSVSTVLSDPPTWARVEAIWARGGEGAILKRRSSTYESGRRSPEWLKVKHVRAATLAIVGFEAGKCGPYSKFALRDASGHQTTVKVPGHAMLRSVTSDPASFIGRQVVISFQERTPDGCYRHGRFDHFAGPAEAIVFTPAGPEDDPMKKKKPVAKKPVAKKPVAKKPVAKLTPRKTGVSHPPPAPSPGAKVTVNVGSAFPPPLVKNGVIVGTKPDPAPTTPWRAAVDWVSAGKKAYETRLRNIALRAAAAGTPTPTTVPPPKPTTVKAAAPRTPVTPPEGDTSRRSGTATRSRTTVERRRTTT